MRRPAQALTLLWIAVSLVWVFPTPGRAGAGDLDPSFGNGGLVEYSLGQGYDGSVGGVVIQNDGKIVVASGIGAIASDGYTEHAWIQLNRFNPDGSVDQSFAQNGHFAQDFGSNSYAKANALALLPSGKILVAGEIDYSDQGAGLFLMRLNSDGSLDKSFGTGGVVRGDSGGPTILATAMAIQANGELVLAGTNTANTWQDIGLMRYKSDGSLDATFGNGGLSISSVAARNRDSIQSMLIDPLGRILVGDSTVATQSTNGALPVKHFAVLRYGPSGNLDPGFGSNGIVVTDFGADLDEDLTSLFETASGRIVAAGRVGSDLSDYFGPGFSIALVGYLEDGSLDPAFGEGGVMTRQPQLPDGATFYLATAAQEADGAIVVGGSAFTDHNLFGLVRFGDDGVFDGSFGDHGLAQTDLGTGNTAIIMAMAVQSDGKVIAVGTKAGPEPYGWTTFELARYEAATCTPNSTHLCLDGGRFRVSLEWTNYNNGNSALATAVPFRDESGFFYFQDPANIEVSVKIHNACATYGHYWFFSSATTDVAYTISATDTKTGQTETYSNPAHVLSEAKTDQSSFSCN